MSSIPWMLAEAHTELGWLREECRAYRRALVRVKESENHQEAVIAAECALDSIGHIENEGRLGPRAYGPDREEE